MAQNFSPPGRTRQRSRPQRSTIPQLEAYLGRLKARAVEARKGSQEQKELGQQIKLLEGQINAARTKHTLASQLRGEARSKKSDERAADSAKRAAQSHPIQLESARLGLTEAQIRAKSRADRDRVIAHTASNVSRVGNWDSKGLLNIVLSDRALQDAAGPTAAGNRILPLELDRIKIGKSIVAGELDRDLATRPEYKHVTRAYLANARKQLMGRHDELVDRADKEGLDPITEGQFIDYVVKTGLTGGSGENFDPIVAGIVYRLERFNRMSPQLQDQAPRSQAGSGLGFKPQQSRVPVADPEEVADTWLDQPASGSNETWQVYEGELGKSDDLMWWGKDPGRRRQQGAMQEIEPTRSEWLKDPRSVLGGVKTRPEALDPDAPEYLGDEIADLPGESLAEKFYLKRNTPSPWRPFPTP